MKVLTILVPENAVLNAIEDPRYLFTTVNVFLQNAGKEPLFDVQLVGLTPEVRLNDGRMTIRPDLTLAEAGRSDLILVPAVKGDIPQVLAENSGFYPWIRAQYENGAEVASLCMGAFLLASTGLLAGKQCSTHWLFAQQFRSMFPDVTLLDDRIICEQNGIYSSGGANSYWNLLLYLVEKYTDREVAILCSKYFLLDIGRDSQSSFIVFKGQKDHEDDLIRAAQEHIEAHFMDKLTVDQLADQFLMGRRTFERRFKKATSNTVVEYIQRVKIEAAKQQLETGRKTVNEVMYDVGYTDIKAFRDVFKKVVGMSPVDYRNKFNKKAAA